MALFSSSFYKVRKKGIGADLGIFWKAQLLSFGLIRLRHTYVLYIARLEIRSPPFELLRILKGVPPAARPPPRPASSYFSSSPKSRFPFLRILWLGRGGRRTWVSASASCSSPSPHGPIREEKRGRCDGGLGVGGRLLTFIAGLLLLPVSGERGGVPSLVGGKERGQWIGGVTRKFSPLLSAGGNGDSERGKLFQLLPRRRLPPWRNRENWLPYNSLGLQEKFGRPGMTTLLRQSFFPCILFSFDDVGEFSLVLYSTK